VRDAAGVFSGDLSGGEEVRFWGTNLSNVKYSDFTFETAAANLISAAPPDSTELLSPFT
jgi:hypothetical protein